MSDLKYVGTEKLPVPTKVYELTESDSHVLVKDSQLNINRIESSELRTYMRRGYLPC